MKKIIVALTPRQVDAYWTLSALYSAQYEGEYDANLTHETRQNLRVHVPNMDQAFRDAQKAALA